MNAIEVQEIRTSEEFMNLKTEWNSLLDNSDTNNFFLTHEWVKNWWKCFGSNKELHILTAKKNNSLIGIAPLMITKSKQMRFIGTPLSDYGDFIINSDQETDKIDVMAAFLDHLFKNKKDWSVIHFDELHERSSTLPMLKMLLSKNAANNYLLYESIGCLSLNLHKANEIELAKLLKKKSIRRHIKSLENQGEFEFKKINDTDEATKALDVFFAQHIAIWNEKKDPSMFNDEKHKKLFKQLTGELLSKGKVVIWALYLNKKIIAMQFGFEHNETYTTYCQSQDLDYAKHSPGTILYKYFIEEYAKNGLRLIDHTRVPFFQ